MPSSSLRKKARSIEQGAKRWLIKGMLRILRPLPRQAEFSGPLDSIVILAQEKLGDAILLTPLLKNLRRARPQLKIHLVCVSPVYHFFERDPHVDVVYRVKQNYPAYFKAILAQRFDLLFSTKDHSSFTFLYQTRLIRARQRVGIDHPDHRGFFNHLLQRDLHQHVIEKNCALLDYLGVPYAPEDCRPYVPEENVSEEVRRFIDGMSPGKLLAINLSAGEKSREWPIAKWKQLLSRLHHPLMIFAMPERWTDKQELENSFSQVVASPATKNLYEAGEMIRRLKLLISPDTSLIHLASCYGTPVAGMYRADPVHLQRFAPYRVPHRLLVSPTSRVEDIPVEEAAAAIDDLLGQRAKGQ
jgi:ADP-heptose:LPS heptosyltransferase